MAIEGIKISLNEVSSTANTIRNLNTNLDARLMEIKNEMNGLAASWQSDASNTIRERFNSLSTKFAEYKEIIDSYAKFLDNTVTNYNSTETAINSNASAFN
ncbi:MAG TPA: WXG100 family type VII secretion target [Clostridiales bacterium]|nr:WXG100 family type VII secretion target [Clostridiales bacterium]